jgi:hypothetical protein
MSEIILYYLSLYIHHTKKMHAMKIVDVIGICVLLYVIYWLHIT